VRFSAAVLALLFAAVAAVGQNSVSNLGETQQSVVPVTATAWYATSFSAGAASNYTLNTVTLRFATAGNTSGGFFVGLYSDNAGVPGSSLEVLTGTGNPSSATDHTFTSSGATLIESATYWIVGGVTSGSGSYMWAYTSALGDDENPVESGWSIGDDAFLSTNAGVNWASDGGVMMFSLTATPIPEPGTYAALLGVAALGFVISRRRRSAEPA
jgi:hypothetical protein